MRKSLFATFLLFSLCCGAATVMVECESFAEKGGWVVDQQFMDQMGSPFLLAHGLGRPVADARTTVKIAESGDYRVWVRTRNWNAPWTPWCPAGVFRVLVNGEELKDGVDLGTKSNEWAWQLAGTVHLESGEAKLALHDKTGFDGRADAVVLSSDCDWVPPESQAVLNRFRRNMGMITDAGDMVSADLVVVGGGIAGICTAVSAARLGMKVALVHDRPIVGGCNSSEVRVHLGGRIGIGPYPKLGGVVAEIGPGPNHFGNAQPKSFYEDARKLAVITAESNISLHTNVHVIGSETLPAASGRRILAVWGRNIETGAETRFSAPLFVDCTGDGNLGALAGAEFRYGREAKSETGEEGAVEVADSQTMGASVQWYSKTVKEGEDAVFPMIEWALKGFDDKNCRPVPMGEWTWETGMRHDQVSEAEYVRDYGLMVVYSNWNYIKNRADDAIRAKFANRTLEWVAYVAGKRESRRLVGPVLLKEQDIVNQVEYPDGTACSSWSIDLHYPNKQHEKEFPGEPFISEARHKIVHYYPVPYRCLYSKNIVNLFMAGRNISVSHVALGTTRVMRTTGMLGEVVGMAASLCKKHQALPNAIYENGEWLEELKGLMRVGIGDIGGQPSQFYNTGSSLSDKKSCGNPKNMKK